VGLKKRGVRGGEKKKKGEERGKEEKGGGHTVFLQPQGHLGCTSNAYDPCGAPHRYGISALGALAAAAAEVGGQHAG